jgi:hypothetical protein
VRTREESIHTYICQTKITHTHSLLHLQFARPLIINADIARSVSAPCAGMSDFEMSECDIHIYRYIAHSHSRTASLTARAQRPVAGMSDSEMSECDSDEPTAFVPGGTAQAALMRMATTTIDHVRIGGGRSVRVTRLYRFAYYFSCVFFFIKLATSYVPGDDDDRPRTYAAKCSVTRLFCFARIKGFHSARRPLWKCQCVFPILQSYLINANVFPYTGQVR